MNNTKNYTMRYRLNRDMEFNENFRKKYVSKDYGNYEKYEKNSVATKYDAGVEATTDDKLYENYMKLIKTLPTQEAEDFEKQKRDDIKDLLTDQNETHQTFKERFFAQKGVKENLNPDLDAFEEECELMEDPETFERAYYGRLSPFVKENVYREYLKGYSIKDLSLKYGILQQRAKAIVYQKHLYWNEVYPRLGETHMRLALEREALYASEFPFIEYGIDLVAMAQLDKGVRVEHITRSEYDTDPPARDKK